MADWKKSRACKTTWTTLTALDQIASVFSKSGTIKMNEMTFWSTGGTADFREVRATTLCNQIDGVFRRVRGAEFEPESDEEKAKSEIMEVLLDKNMTVADLAQVADNNYCFLNEKGEA